MSVKPRQTLDGYRKNARALKKAYASAEPEALERAARQGISSASPKHADFLHVVAREAGFASWPKLKLALEIAGMSRPDCADRLRRALYFGQHWVTHKLLAEDPDLAQADFGLEVALYDLAAVRKAVDRDPRAATQLAGVRSPILHLAYSREIHRSPEKAADMLAIAELLVNHGANVNDGYRAASESDHTISALYGALCHADNPALGEWLLAQGANPDDNESLYHATELGHTDALKALLAHGASPSGTNALPRALDFDDIEKVRLLLQAGANPNEAAEDHPSGHPMDTIPALHQAARRGASVDMVTLLLDFGADPSANWDGHTPYAMARIYGNDAVAGLLAERGAPAHLDFNERILAACADGAAPPERLDLEALSAEDRGLLTKIAFQPGRLEHLKALVTAGLDPDARDDMGLPPLHVAGWNGLADEFRYFLGLQPDLAYRNKFGGDALDTIVHGAEFAPKRPGADHIACARMALKAGATLFPDYVSGCGEEEMAVFLEDWALRT
ncbi:ankyrin repeat domain-containing protein [Roseibium sp. RKSG952]|uniref:ankyrin repeat domain-containing protein n=1 Tax=Roseibium sp. RKSG952 TaxID=2529384 RepID=UPI0012BBD878|nr:ankyrin repeat domain-containing protein [Roseibium sp. RKSG952]MTH98359.1 ankyrin repeat domain-containing protein [Roseibium sp. RKSG952]